MRIKSVSYLKIALLHILCYSCNCLNAQDTTSLRLITDSLRSMLSKESANLIDSLKSYPRSLKAQLLAFSSVDYKSKLLGIRNLDSSSAKTTNVRLKNGVRISGGYIRYNFESRSFIDTPFADKNVIQQRLHSSVNVLLFDILPFQVNSYLRRTNSDYFRNIHDIQLVFDQSSFRNRVSGLMQSGVISEIEKWKDVSLENLYSNNYKKLGLLKRYVENPISLQKLIEYNEVIRVPKVMYDFNLPDSINKIRTDSLGRIAKLFLEEFQYYQHVLDSLQRKGDSLQTALQQWNSRIQEYKSAVGSRNIDWASFQDFLDKSKKYGTSIGYPKAYEWLLGIRNFAVGKTVLNHSELTSKNLPISGINFEYNSWYYLAVSAGRIDYRFRDFAVPAIPRKDQFLYLVRIGIGRLESNYAILTALKGRKQISTFSSAGNRAVIDLRGLSLETRLKVSKNTYALLEISQSISPDLRSTPFEAKTHWKLSDKSSKALAVKWFSNFPRTATRIEGMYKYLGANYQSFNSFQTNALTQVWYLKGEQSFFKRQFRIVASIRSNDYSNPYIAQVYRSTGTSKTISAILKIRRFPSISIGYLPISQYTKIDNAVYETNFQSLTANLNHFYRIGIINASSSFVFNKLFNKAPDSLVAYYSASNAIFSQSLNFQHYSATSNISVAKNNYYTLIVLEEGLTLNMLKRASLTTGVKVNTLKHIETKLGGYLSLNLRIHKVDLLSIHFERGYLQTQRNDLEINTIGSIHFTKIFR